MNPSRELALAPEQPANDSTALLDANCKGDSTLRQRLDALLSAHEQPATVLDPMTQAIPPNPGIPFAGNTDEAIGKTLGRYELLKRVKNFGAFPKLKTRSATSPPDLKPAIQSLNHEPSPPP